VGTSVTITGVSLTQATRVAFGAVAAAAFTVNSDTQITATVPTGAKTGKIGIRYSREARWAVLAPARSRLELCLPWGPGQAASAEQVNVEVEDGLSRAGADVDDGAVSLFDVALAGDLGGGEVAAADDFGVGGLRLF
jgi:hypothetical protein